MNFVPTYKKPPRAADAWISAGAVPEKPAASITVHSGQVAVVYVPELDPPYPRRGTLRSIRAVAR